jgi:hypothetical protein
MTITYAGSLAPDLVASSCAVVYLDTPVVFRASSAVTNCAPSFQASPLKYMLRLHSRALDIPSNF